MRNSWRNVEVLLPALFIFFNVCLLFCAENTMAISNTTINKILLNNAQDCFNGTVFSEGKEFTVGVNGSSEFLQFVKLFNKPDNAHAMVPTGVAGITEYGKSAQETGERCRYLLTIDSYGNGMTGSMDGIFKRYGVSIPNYDKPSAPSTIRERAEFLRKLGYDETVNKAQNDEIGCFNVFYEVTNKSDSQTPKDGMKVNVAKVCWPMEYLEKKENLSMETASVKDIYQDTNPGLFTHFGEFTIFGVSNGAYLDLTPKDKYNGERLRHSGGSPYFSQKSFKADGKEYIMGIDNSFYSWGKVSVEFRYTMSKENVTEKTETSYIFKTNDATKLYDSAAKNLFGLSSGLNEVTKEEKIELYTAYLENVFGVSTADAAGCQAEKPENPISDGGVYVCVRHEWCLAPVKHGDRFVTAFNDDLADNKLNVVIGFQDLATKLYNLTGDDEDCGDGASDGGDPGNNGHTPGGTDPDLNGDGDSEASDLQRCMKMSNSLGWILCPVIQWLNDGVQGIYSRVESDFLIVQSSFFENKNVKEIWESMLGFADTFLVVVIVAIVFSQLTGVGIDNYGIKRILPKVIVVAILVNMSYLICQIAVEVSNIVGKSLNDMLSVGISVAPGEMADSKGSLLFGTLLTAISGGLIGGVAASFVTGGWFAVLIPLLVALVTALVAVFFFFIMLGIRKAAIIILVLVSPLAMVCYALPNTKNIFDRWLKYFKSLLLLFPICGAMMGGGQLMAKLLMSVSTDYFMAFTGLMLMVVPFFFIPKFLRGALDAIGGIGAAVTGMSRKIGGGASRAAGRLEKSDYVQDSMNRRAGERARRIAENYRQRRQNGEILSAREGRRYARYNKHANEWELANDPAHLDAILASQNKAVSDQRVKDDETLIRSGGVAGLNADNTTQVSNAYQEALNAIGTNPNDEAAITRAEALQNILMGTEKGRNSIQNNLGAAARGAARSGSQEQQAAYGRVAQHLTSNHGGTLKAANRSTMSMVSDIAAGNTIKSNKAYTKNSLEGYSASSLAGADTQAVQDLVKQYSSGDSSYREALEQLKYDMLAEGSSVKPKQEVQAVLGAIPAVNHRSTS